jgi:hypothetical protein
LIKLLTYVNIRVKTRKIRKESRFGNLVGLFFS